MNINFLWLYVAALLLLTACAGSVSKDWQEQLKTCPTSVELGRFSPWDRLEIRVFGEAELSGEYEVSPRGTLSFPILGELRVEGLRCDEIESIVRDGLEKTYLRNPSVVCINKEVSRTAVTVDGQVNRPGIVEFRPGLMLTDVIAQSGGLTPRAQANSVVITRKADNSTLAVTVPYYDILSAKAPNVCLHPADLVFIPSTVF
ncbi:MAG: polysaccharide biosynthesis/export family protein [Bradymonadales bacterium]|jgi:protein involved in polysaccharide export with SLBB domain